MAKTARLADCCTWRNRARFDELAEKMACNRRESEAKKQDPDADAETPAATKIPFRIDDGIIARSLTNPAHIARSRIIGATQGEFILITEPTVKINDRVSAVLDQQFPQRHETGSGCIVM